MCSTGGSAARVWAPGRAPRLPTVPASGYYPPHCSRDVVEDAPLMDGLGIRPSVAAEAVIRPPVLMDTRYSGTAVPVVNELTHRAWTLIRRLRRRPAIHGQRHQLSGKHALVVPALVEHLAESRRADTSTLRNDHFLYTGLGVACGCTALLIGPQRL